MNDKELRAWLNNHAANYDTALDAGLAPLMCKCCWDRADVETVIGWKLNKMGNRLATAHRNLAKNSDFDIQDPHFASVEEAVMLS